MSHRFALLLPSFGLPPTSAIRLAEIGSSVLGVVAVTALAVNLAVQSGAPPAADVARKAAPEPVARASSLSAATAIGAYGGVSYTHPSAVRIVNPGRTDLTVDGFNWAGRPFDNPIYYGARVQRWLPGGTLGTMLDFTHAKAIAVATDEARFSGQHEGWPMAPRARIGDVFRNLEFSHGHNMLTLNGLVRWPELGLGVRPYVGIGAGISLPHTEVAFRGGPGKTYLYQFAGFVGQLLGGLELRIGPASVFIEYKLTYAPYDIPLSHIPDDILPTDLWRQLQMWLRGEGPPGGRLGTTLLSHHGIAGALYRFGGQPTAAP